MPHQVPIVTRVLAFRWLLGRALLEKLTASTLRNSVADLVAVLRNRSIAILPGGHP